MHRAVRDVVVAGHRGDHELVEEHLDHPAPEVRIAALGAAARLRRLEEARLVAAMADLDRSVRRRAVELAGRRPPTDALRRALLTALDDEPIVAEMAAFSLGEHGGHGEHDDAPGGADPAVGAALSHMARHHDDHLCREAAVAALGAIGVGLPVILQALAEDRATVRRRAVIALAPFDGPEVDDALHRALEDRDWQVRQAAEDLLAP